MDSVASQITSLTIVYSAVYSGADQRKHQRSAGVTGLCAGNSPGTGEFTAQLAINAENVSIWWRHHMFDKVQPFIFCICKMKVCWRIRRMALSSSQEGILWRRLMQLGTNQTYPKHFLNWYGCNKGRLKQLVHMQLICTAWNHCIVYKALGICLYETILQAGSPD